MLNRKKTPNFGCEVGTHFRIGHPIFCSNKDRLCLIRWCVKFQQPNPFLKSNLSHLEKIIFDHSEGGWEGQNKFVPCTYEATHWCYSTPQNSGLLQISTTMSYSSLDLIFFIAKLFFVFKENLDTAGF